MRQVILWNMMTLDGYFEGPKSWEIDWLEYTWGDELEAFSIEQLHTADTILFGRITYEGMAAHWPTETGEVADLMNSFPKVVFSRTLDKAEWQNTRLVNGDAAEEVARLKQQAGKNILVFGSANLCASLMQKGLIDEYRIGVNPVILGGGNPLFNPGAERMKMTLLETKPLGSGCVILRYAPA